MPRVLSMVAAVLLLLGRPISAQEVPRFFIESIEVRNNERVSPDVIVAESRLRPGRTYTELELREASDRVNRLRFLISADLSLEKGADRGMHRLVISVNETRVFFFSIGGIVFWDGESVADRGPDEEVDNQFTEAVVGWRFFVGHRGAVHFGLLGANDTRGMPGHTSFAVGYTQYDLFGTSAFATLNLKKAIDGGGGSISPQVVVGVPFTPRQTLTLMYDSFDRSEDSFYYAEPGTPGDPGERLPYLRSDSHRLLRATWTLNTTNSPFFPTRGALLALSAVDVESERSFLRWSRRDGPSFYFPAPVSEETVMRALEATARRYWETSERDSVFAGMTVGATRDEGDASDLGRRTLDGTYGGLTLGFSRSLRDPAVAARFGESRILTELRLRAGDRDPLRPSPWSAEFPFERDRSDASGDLSVTWVRRNAWGTWGFGVGYAW